MSKVCLITGASAGIGAGIALAMSEKGHNLALVARRRDKLEEVARQCKEKGAKEAIVVVKDLSDYQQCKEAVEEAVEKFGSRFYVMHIN